MWMWPELPGWPCIGFAMKHGVMPYFIPTDFARSLIMLDGIENYVEAYLKSAALSAISFTGDTFRAWTVSYLYFDNNIQHRKLTASYTPGPPSVCHPSMGQLN
jgi:hypothetical protein